LHDQTALLSSHSRPGGTWSSQTALHKTVNGVAGSPSELFSPRSPGTAADECERVARLHDKPHHGRGALNAGTGRNTRYLVRNEMLVFMLDHRTSAKDTDCRCGGKSVPAPPARVRCASDALDGRSLFVPPRMSRREPSVAVARRFTTTTAAFPVPADRSRAESPVPQ